MDQRVVDTKKKLREALFFLLDEKPLEKISRFSMIVMILYYIEICLL